MAGDQRYCLHCGERRMQMSSLLRDGPPTRPGPESSFPPPDAPAGFAPPADGGWQRGSTPTLLAGVGVLLLAMGVGVLIGRSGSSKPAASQVISVASTPSAGTTAATSAEPSFAGNWSSGISGFTVQLKTLPQAGTTVSAVEAAKANASAKGAKGVGALRSEDFSSLAAGHYVIYSGVYHKKAEAEKALAGLRKLFPSASVVEVSNRASAGHAGGSSSRGSGSGSNVKHPAPPSVLENLKGVKGKSYEERSKNLPNVISTG
ncbi:MAG: hypothetical protein QOI89_1473 [Solirubrobacteraceae bacterium]|jgi:hypothetical protein|nr:hypothetical protein [Solirubrobacteraceae bacterium]